MGLLDKKCVEHDELVCQLQLDMYLSPRWGNFTKNIAIQKTLWNSIPLAMTVTQANGTCIDNEVIILYKTDILSMQRVGLSNQIINNLTRSD